MKKVLFGIVGFIVVLVVVALVAPSFVDWNDHKARLASYAKTFTGRILVIDGDIQAAILPSPVLIAQDVKLSNLEGATAAQMVRLKSVEVRVALGPLLGGNVEVQTVKLVDPVIDAEILADGRKNWELTGEGGSQTATAPVPAKGGEPTSAEGTAAGAAPSDPPIRLESFVIENGTVIYRDARSGTVEKIEALNARIAAASLSGPVKSSGTLVARGIPLKFLANIGKIIQGRTVPISLALEVEPGGTKAQISGTVVSLTSAPKFKGKVKAEGANLAGLAGIAVDAGDLPGIVAQAFGLEGAVVASAEGAEVTDLALRLGEIEAKGEIALALGETTNVSGQLSVNHIDLDKLAPPPKAKAADAGDKKSEDDKVRAKASIALDAPQANKKPTPQTASGIVLPTNVTVSVGLVVDTVTFRGGLVRYARANAELASGEVTISQLSAQLPGSSEVAAFGFVTFPKGTPQFEGEVEVTVSDLRRVMDWLDVKLDQVPSDRLRKLTLTSNIKASPKEAQIANINLRVDNSRLTGGVTVALRKRLAFGADFTLDRINLDGYLPAAPAGKEPDSGAKAVADKEGSTESAAADAGKKGAGTPAANPFAALQALEGVDANLRLRVGSLVYRKAPVQDVVLDATLYNGVLEVRRASVANLAGASAKVSGTIGGLASGLTMKGVEFDVRAKDSAGLFRLAGVQPPVSPRNLGAVSVKGRIDGDPLAPKVNLSIQAAGASLGLAGTAALLPGPSFDMRVSVKHGDMARLLRALEIDYRPAGRIGGLDVSAVAKGTPSQFALGGIKGTLSKIAVEGSAVLDLAGARPKITASLATSDVVVDPFLPAKRTAAAPFQRRRAYGRPGIVPAAWPQPSRANETHDLLRLVARAASERWPRDPIDLSVLQAFDADLKVRSRSIAFETYRVENADIAATVANGILRAERFTGVVFGGALKANAVVNSAPAPRIDATVALKDVDIGQAVSATTGKNLASGSMQLDLKIATGGGSVAAMVAALGGNGSVALSRLDVKGGAEGSALAAAVGLVQGLNQLGGVLGGGKPGKDLADITGTFTIQRGVARSSDFKFASNLGSGQAKGSVDLPNWTIDVIGEVNLAQNLLSQILAKNTNAPQSVPLHITGRLDSPSVKIDTSKIAAGGLTLPGVDKLLKKDRGVGKVLQQILGGKPKQEQPQAQPQPKGDEPPPPPQQQKKAPNPVDILKDLFKRR